MRGPLCFLPPQMLLFQTTAFPCVGFLSKGRELFDCWGGEGVRELADESRWSSDTKRLMEHMRHQITQPILLILSVIILLPNYEDVGRDGALLRRDVNVCVCATLKQLVET